MCNIRKETWKKKEEEKERNLYILFKQREGVLLFFSLGRGEEEQEKLGVWRGRSPRLGCWPLD
jgi:hypothetical protein